MSEKRRVKKKAASSVPTVVPAAPLTDSPIDSFASPVAPPTLPTFGMINPISSLGVIDALFYKALVGKGGDIFKNISLAKELMANDVVVGTFNTHSWEGIDIPTEDIFPIHTSLENDFGWTSFGEYEGKVFYKLSRLRLSLMAAL